VPDVATLAHEVVQREPEDLVRRLGEAVLAAQGDATALKAILDNVADLTTMRALRVVPLPAAVTKLCEIVERGLYADDTYEAIVALGHVPATSVRAEKAARSLEMFIAAARSFPRFDEMRVRAVMSLGQLGVPAAGAVLLDETTDDHPAVVREAARALVKVLGDRTASARAVERAIKAGRDQAAKYAAALRWMPINLVVDEIEAAMVSGSSDTQLAARALLSEIGGAAALQKLMARARSTDQYTAVLEQAETRVREMFESSIAEARRGFWIAMAMDVLVFLAGIGLILTSAVLILRSGGTLASWAGIALTGGTGVLGVLYSILVAKPRQQVGQTVDHLMHLQIVFLGYLRQLHQADQAYTRRLLEDDKLALDEVSRFAQMVGLTMTHATEQLAPGRLTRP
jgi:HEAT repeat protein